jgi:hypothetical protein
MRGFVIVWECNAKTIKKKNKNKPNHKHKKKVGFNVSDLEY